MLNETGASRARDFKFAEEEEAAAVQKKLDEIAQAQGVDVAKQVIAGSDLKNESAHIEGMLNQGINDLLGEKTEHNIEHASDEEIEDVLKGIENPNRGFTAPLKGATGRLDSLSKNTKRLDSRDE